MLASSSSEPTCSYSRGDFDDAIDFDFQLPQTVPEDPQAEVVGGDKYGFNNQYSGVFTYLQTQEVITCVEPEGKSALERWREMRQQEDMKFDREWCLADKLDPPGELTEILSYSATISNESFTPEEQSHLRNLGNKDCTSPEF